MSKRRGPAPCTTPRNNIRLEPQELKLLINTLEVELGVNEAAVVYTDVELQVLANKLRWAFFKEKAKNR